MIKAYKKTRFSLIGLMTIISVFTVLPFYIMLIMSTYYSNDLFKKIVLLPGRYFIENFKTVLESNFLRFYFNSAYIAITVAICATFISAMTGYALAKYKFKGKKVVFNGVLLLMMIPMQLGLIAFVWEMRFLGWNNTHLALIIPSFASNFGVFWMTQYIKGSVPTEVIESARIDGSSEMRTFLQIVLPFVKPALTSLGLLFFLWSWNSYLTPLVIISKINLYTVPLGIGILDELYRVDYSAQLLGLSVSTIPVIILFAVFSKTLIRGLASVAVKG